MATFSKELFSGSSGGQGIKVVATASLGTTIHATNISAMVKDEIWLYATNTSGSAVTLTLEWGGTSSPDDIISLNIPSLSGLTLIIPGLILTGNGSTARTIRAFASTSNVVVVTGYVNRIT